MVWLHPAILFALAAVAAPILIHILVQRRHLLEDPLLLTLRIAIVAAAVAAIAGPFVMTRARRDEWNRRIVRATVMEEVPGVSGGASPGGEGVFQTREFRGPSLADGIRRAVEWLDAAPPARRELIVAAPLTIGSLSAADIADVPASVGLRFERVGTLPRERTVSYGSVRSVDRTVEREVTLAGAQTSVRDRSTGGPAATGDRAFPLEVRAAPPARPFVDAAMAAVLGERVWSPTDAHPARLILVSTGNEAELGEDGFRDEVRVLPVTAREPHARRVEDRVDQRRRCTPDADGRTAVVRGEIDLVEVVVEAEQRVGWRIAARYICRETCAI